MFDLVADVEAYPQFVPLCESLSIRSRREKGEISLLIADMTVAYKLFRETFTSQVALNRPRLEIDVSYVDGPFRHLHNQWRFEPAGEGESIVHFLLDYEFKSKTLEFVMGSVFELAFSKFTTAFEERADVLYGADGADTKIS